jgi:hypothetical protein
VSPNAALITAVSGQGAAYLADLTGLGREFTRAELVNELVLSDYTVATVDSLVKSAGCQAYGSHV